MNIKHWLCLIVPRAKKPLSRNTKYYDEKRQDKDKRYPVHGKFSDYGNTIAEKMGL